jgi:hypothetical protein
MLISKSFSCHGTDENGEFSLKEWEKSSFFDLVIINESD